MSTTENILINVREDGSRVVVVNINAIANASVNAHNSVTGLTRALGAFSAMQLAKQYFEMADAVTLLDARLRLATKGSEEFRQAQADIYRVSQDGNVGLRETTRLYTKLAEPIRNLGGDIKEMTGIVDAFATGLRVSGANTQEAAAATLQFAQALNKGKLDGDEFRTMAEVAPRVMRAMADGMGVPVGKLKEMAKEGKLTSDVIGNALLSQLKTLKEEGATIGDTVGGAMSDLANDTLIAVGAFDKMSGASAGMSDIIQGVSLIVFELAQVFRDEIKDGTEQADHSFEQTGLAIRALGTIMETLMLLGSDVSYTFKAIGREIGGVAAQMAALASGDFAQVGAIREMMIADNKTATTELERYQERILGMTDRALAARDKLKNAKPGEIDTDFKTLKAVASESDLIKVRMRLTGVTQTYFNDMDMLQKALANNQVTTEEYTALMGDLAKKTWDASAAGKAFAKANRPERGSDDRLKLIQAEMVNLKSSFDGEESLYEKRNKMLNFYHSRLGMSDAEFYQGREAARQEFIAAEEKSYMKEKALLESFKPRNAQEVAANQQRLNELLSQHTAFYDKLSDARTEDELEQLAATKEIQSASNDAGNQYLTSLYEQLQGLKTANDARVQSVAAIERETVATLELAIANLRLNASSPITADHTQADVDAANSMIQTLSAELEIRKGISHELDKQQKHTLKNKAAQTAIKDWKDAGKDIAEGLKATFGDVGESLGGIFKAYADSAADQLRITNDLEKAIKGLPEDDPARIDAINRAQQESARNQVKAYADMAGSAKGFFKENTTGYKVLEATEKAYRAFELGIAISNAVKKLAVESASTAKSSALAGTEASAWGITAVVKAIASMPYPANIAAGAATLAAVIAVGAKMSGGISGAGGATAAQVQERQGTGTVFGSPDAKSDSISRSLERMQEAQGDLIPLNVQMLNSLKNIERSMGGLTNIIIRTPGMTSGSNFGIQEGQLKYGKPTDVASQIGTAVTKGLLGPGLGDKVAGFVNNLWGKRTQTIVDSGIQFGGSLRGLQSGQGYSQYASVDNTKSSFFGLSKKTTNSVQTTGLSSELTDQLSMVFKDMENVLVESAKAMGGKAEDVTSVLENLNIEMSSLSLKGLKGDEITQAINAVISKALDQMGSAVFPEIEQFARLGEGYAETVIRIATNYAQLDASLNMIGKTMGLTGIESLGARESLIDMLGGIEEVSSKTGKFADDFLTEAQRLAPIQQYVNAEFAKMNQALPATREAFADLVLSQDLMTEKGRENFAILINVSEAFSMLTPALKEAGRSAQDIADERETLQSRLDESTLSFNEKIDKQRLAIDDSNKALFDQVIAAEAAAEAIKAEAEAKKAAAIVANTLLDTQMRIYELLNDKVGMATILQQQHTAALEAMDPSLREATQNLWNLEAAAAAVAAIKADASSLMGQVDDAFNVVQTSVNREKQLKIDAYNEQMKALDKSIELETEAIALRKTSVTAAVAAFKALSDAIRSTVDRMKAQDISGTNRAVAQGQLQDALKKARAGGGLPTAEAFKNTLAALGENSTDLFVSMEDWKRDFRKTQAGLEELGSYSDKALSVEERTLKSLEDHKSVLTEQKKMLQEAHEGELKRLDGIIADAKSMVDHMKGVESNTLTIAQSIEGLRLAILGAMQNPVVNSTSAINSAYEKSLGRAPEKAGMDFWQDAIAKGTPLDTVVKSIETSMEAKIQGLYKEVLGRAADADGLKFFMNSGASIDDIRAAMKTTDEFRNKALSLTNSSGQAPMAYATMSGQSARRTGDTSNLEGLIGDLIATVEVGNGHAEQFANILDELSEGGNMLRVDLTGNTANV